ncbi:MAG: 3-carboxy-cis,cis-muconate cycloisomerase [Marinobacter sp.]|uniref:3-carboxy-cis,cis-muconate cycloisomerase n=1 Tax=Marinobacter sp. TaxID=50741 RepID=UPI0034A025C4
MSQSNLGNSGLYNGLLSDQECGQFLSDQTQIKAMLKVEGQLALAQAEAGLIPHQAASAINQAALSIEPDLASLSAGTASAGVPVPALVKALKDALAPEIARWVHFGATSQDIVDTALVLNCRSLVEVFESRLLSVVGMLGELAERQRSTLIAGRTRTQQAVPMSFGLKIVTWIDPLLRQHERLAELKPRLLKIQLGGAVGSLIAMGSNANAVALGLADRLDLRYAPSWHTQRDSLMEFSGWLAMTTGSLGKMGEDWLRMAQTEMGELRFSNGGGSSTMPQKCNPVNAEIMVAMARQNAGLAGQMQQCMLHEHERSGVAWTQEWLVLPQMLMGTAVSLRHCLEGLHHLEISPDRIDANLNSGNGLIYAEAATFILAGSMSRDEASEHVARACQSVAGSERHLFDVLKDLTGRELDLQQIKQDLLAGGATESLIDETLRNARTLLGRNSSTAQGSN